MKVKKSINICVIDEPLNLHLLQVLIGYNHNNIALIQNAGTSLEFAQMSHGTLCTALLLEALCKHRIEHYVHIVHFSITDNSGEKSLTQLLEALKYCEANEIDIISMSVGLLGRIYTKNMCSALDRLKRTIVVAAASNRFALTYPAALPQVLGVKRKLKGTGTGQIEWIDNPVDGIELVADLPETSVVEKLREQYDYCISESNSVLVPQICAQLAVEMLENPFFVRTKKAALICLAKAPRSKVVEDYTLPEIPNLDKEDWIPAIMLPYNCSTAHTVFDLAISLQQKFEREEYPCAILSDQYSQSDFQRGWYTLDASYPENCLVYYRRAIADGLILAPANRNSKIKPVCDWYIERQENTSVTILYSKILQHFS